MRPTGFLRGAAESGPVSFFFFLSSVTSAKYAKAAYFAEDR